MALDDPGGILADKVEDILDLVPIVNFIPRDLRHVVVAPLLKEGRFHNNVFTLS